MTELNAVKMLQALSHEIRINVVRFLVECGEDGASAGDIGIKVDAEPSKISFHLTKLEHAKIISSSRKARKIIYRAEFENLGGLVSFILNDCCGDHPDIRCCLSEDCC